MADVGDTITKTFLFVDSAGDPANPDTVQIIHRKPDLTETVYEFGIDSEVTNPAVGSFALTLQLVDYRRHYFRAYGTGTVPDQSPAEVFEDVTESFFLVPIPA